MKKKLYNAALLCQLFFFVGCSSAPDRNASIPVKFPAFVKNALKKIPGDVLVGIGVAESSNLSMGMNISASRARAEIARQLNSIVNEMIVVTNSNERTFKETITVTITRSYVSGSKIILQEQAGNGSIWTIVTLDKKNTFDEINMAQTHAKSAVPAMVSFNVGDRIDKAYANALTQKYQANGL